MSFNKPLKGVLKLKVVITAKTGLHIGGAKENVEIGGIDNIVEKLKVFFTNTEINGKRKFLDIPYIPGSSLKGKIRSLIEWIMKPKNDEGRDQGSIIALSFDGDPCKCGKCIVCQLFGAHQAQGQEPVRLRFDDFYPTEDTIRLWENTLDSGYVEVKVENMINRIKGVAENPRHTERVIAGSEFEGYITVRIFESDNLNTILETLKTGFEMLEDDYLGGSGSRGYGRVKIRIEGYEYKKVENGKYTVANSENDISNAVEDKLGDFIKRVEEAINA
ncbi:type III-A CRISPR-associated RAMP protein Csm3 [Hydrogenivirga sp. 128-5-R1-1]|uniref:type III-A CRISPR-associated RAMP protein Csm3 n=1 Tax=Hydrogenivirga sp. 128-5-R1-1 TaxID=392423 RepID=UPI00015F17B3|nr:type III-A CRISPR-associated RAMP protein Csm3 [Hydrogenivirga sp. 128-5-R1-1]EDP76112.1 hypothetical protein HG1285_18119 [Hydrogenivirga sp. 128-5-R1-1]